MLTIISGTNRPNSNTRKIATAYSTALSQLNIENQLFSLDQLPDDFIVSDFYGKRSPAFQGMLDQFILPAEKLVMVVPEYNGSYPGIFKLLIDAIPPANLQGKKAALVGVASGRGGNLRGVDDLTNAFHYLQINVFYQKLIISLVREVTDTEQVTSEITLKMIGDHARAFSGY